MNKKVPKPFASAAYPAVAPPQHLATLVCDLLEAQ